MANNLAILDAVTAAGYISPLLFDAANAKSEHSKNKDKLPEDVRHVTLPSMKESWQAATKDFLNGLDVNSDRLPLLQWFARLNGLAFEEEASADDICEAFQEHQMGDFGLKNLDVYFTVLCACSRMFNFTHKGQPFGIKSKRAQYIGWGTFEEQIAALNTTKKIEAYIIKNGGFVPMAAKKTKSIRKISKPSEVHYVEEEARARIKELKASISRINALMANLRSMKDDKENDDE